MKHVNKFFEMHEYCFNLMGVTDERKCVMRLREYIRNVAILLIECIVIRIDKRGRSYKLKRMVSQNVLKINMLGSNLVFN